MSFASLTRMRNDLTRSVGDCLLSQWKGDVVKTKAGVACNPQGSKFSGIFHQNAKPYFPQTTNGYKQNM